MTDTTTEGAGMAKPKPKRRRKKHTAAGKAAKRSAAPRGAEAVQRHAASVLKLGWLARCILSCAARKPEGEAAIMLERAMVALDEGVARAARAQPIGAGQGGLTAIFRRLAAQAAAVHREGLDPDTLTALAALHDDLLVAVGDLRLAARVN